MYSRFCSAAPGQGGSMEYGVIGTSEPDTKDGLEELCPVCGDKVRTAAIAKIVNCNSVMQATDGVCTRCPATTTASSPASPAKDSSSGQCRTRRSTPAWRTGVASSTRCCKLKSANCKFTVLYCCRPSASGARTAGSRNVSTWE